MESEQSLVKHICKGDRAAMQRLYNLYVGHVTAVAMRYVADRDAAQDVLQDSFVKIFTRMGDFEYRGAGSLKAWMTRIVMNESLSYLKNHAKLIYTDALPDEPESDPPVEKVPPSVLQKMIEGLPPGYRTVINMYVFEQKSHKEIAQALGIKESSSASQYLRAKKILAKEIKEYIKRRQ